MILNLTGSQWRLIITWVPTLNLGQQINLNISYKWAEAEKVAKRAERAANRRKRRQEIIEKEIADKLKKINELVSLSKILSNMLLSLSS